MLSRFHFIGFEPDLNDRLKANRTLDRLMNMAPYGSVSVALLEKSEPGYRASIDIYSKHAPFSASVVAASASDAISRIEQAIAEKLLTWRDTRFAVASRPGRRDLTALGQSPS